MTDLPAENIAGSAHQSDITDDNIKTVIVDGRAYTIVNFYPNQFLVELQCALTGRKRWTDWLAAKIVDPHKSPEALIEALGALDADEDELES